MDSLYILILLRMQAKRRAIEAHNNRENNEGRRHEDHAVQVQPRAIIRRPCRQRILRPRTSLLGMPETDVVRRYHLSSRAILSLYEDLRNDIEPLASRNHAIPGLAKLLSALHFFATGSFQNAVGIVGGMTQASFSRHFSQVLQAMMKRMKDYIKYPEQPAQLQEIAHDFYEIAGIPNVIGAIDCIHIALSPKSDQELAFLNQNQFYSMNVQVVCDAHLKILNVVSRFPGSCHDSYILARSALGCNFAEGKYGDGWLLGDAGYGCKSWLLTPLLAPCTDAERRYNEAHTSTRSVIARTFSVLKSRFRCLDQSGGALQYSPEKVACIAMACCMLHNIALRFGMEDDADDLPPDPPIQQAAETDTTMRGSEIRQKLIADYFS
ncbi:putative nuclease HARBI1 [Rhinatrema bivittatum]|uniref:putative nuclease HARBI1 n=1 Tax=Rhinatrema bivittatum TaxID=194408 RepID=UPI001127E788|nr:putative nuclease HARBI1 [Rhinatrema bivittatum]